MLALERRQPEIAEQIIDALSKQPETLRILDAMLTRQDKFCWNCLMLALDREQLDIAERIIDVLSEQPGALEVLLNQQDKSGRSCQSIFDSNAQYSDIANRIGRILRSNQEYHYGP